MYILNVAHLCAYKEKLMPSALNCSRLNVPAHRDILAN